MDASLTGSHVSNDPPDGMRMTDGVFGIGHWRSAASPRSATHRGPDSHAAAPSPCRRVHPVVWRCHRRSGWSATENLAAGCLRSWSRAEPLPAQSRHADQPPNVCLRATAWPTDSPTDVMRWPNSTRCRFVYSVGRDQHIIINVARTWLMTYRWNFAVGKSYIAFGYTISQYPFNTTKDGRGGVLMT